MTVITPGGPCLTKTQIARNEIEERFQQKQQAENADKVNPYSAQVSALDKITETSADNSTQARQSYGAPGPHSVDILV